VLVLVIVEELLALNNRIKAGFKKFQLIINLIKKKKNSEFFNRKVEYFNRQIK